MIWGIHISRCVYAVAELGIADLLADGPVSSAELATATAPTSHRSTGSFARSLRWACSKSANPRRFSLTVIGERLRTGAPAGMRSWAVFLEALGGVRPFGHILETIKTGRSGLEIEFGIDVFDFVAQNPEAAAIFDAAMSERTAAYAPSVADSVRLLGHSHDRRRRWRQRDAAGRDPATPRPPAAGLLFEIPTVAARADAVLDATDIADRCEVLAGDFFERVPENADCYVLANVIHDWNDARAIEILRNCRQAMSSAGQVLIVERLIPEDRCRPSANSAQRHQHARAHRRSGTHQRRVRQAPQRRRTEARERPVGRVPLRRDRGPRCMSGAWCGWLAERKFAFSPRGTRC